MRIPPRPIVAHGKRNDSSGIRGNLTKQREEPVIPPRSNRNTPVEYDRAVYRRGNLIERCVNHSMQFHRSATG
jgi:hypothetical protein